MKKFLSPLLFLFSLAGSSEAKETLPFRIKEPTKFERREDNQFLGLDKISNFIGVLYQNQDEETIENQIDIYEFRDLSDLQVTKELCLKLANKIFGPLGKISLVVTAEEIRPSRSKGKICSLGLRDEDPEAQIKERRLFVSITKLKVLGYVFRYEKIPTQLDLENSYGFLEKLK